MLLLSGCGQIGAPLPPSANLPMPASNFRAQRRGEQVQLRWTTPRRTSDGLPISGAVQVRLCIWPAKLPQAAPLPGLTCPAWQALFPAGAPGDLPQGLKLPLARITPAEPVAAVRLAIAFANRNGRAAGWSNWQLVSLLPVSPPPRGLQAQRRSDGIELSWQAPQPAPSGGVRLYRREWETQPRRGKGKAAPAAPTWQPVLDLPGTQTSYLDREVRPGWVYQYTLRSLAGDGALQAVSAEAKPAMVQTQPWIPLPPPAGLVAVLGLGARPAVQLSWQPVESERLAGYILYRQRLASASEGARAHGWQRVNAELLLTPAGEDRAAWSGNRAVRYAVSAVDQAGRAGQRSAPVVITLPAGNGAGGG